MNVFRDTAHLYRVFRALFERLAQEPEIADRLLQSNLVVRFVFRDPDGECTIDLRSAPVHYTFGPSDLKPDVEMIQSADAAHQFWLGRVNVPQAIATRKIVSRGSVPKALALLPAIKPAFDIYPQVLREIGETDLIPKERAASRSRRGGIFQRLREAFARSGVPAIDYDALNLHYIPLVDGEPMEAPRQFRPSSLPTDKAQLKVEMLRRMMLIRAFEQVLSDEFAAGSVPSEVIHLSIGQEACAVGVCFALRASDAMTTTHRGHGHMLAKGADLQGMMAEIFGKANGLCGGKGGSMHVTDAEVGALGANGIVGASVVIANGAALSTVLECHGTPPPDGMRVAVAFMGDGATNQGMFHEGLNFAAVFDLPVVFVVENNRYGEFTPLVEHTRVARLSERAAAYGIPGTAVDGNDVWAVYEIAREAVARARSGRGPTLLELVTYRWHGHMEGEAVTYRPEDEVATWKSAAHDPIARWQQRLIADGLLDTEHAAALRREAEQVVADALAFAKASAEPDHSEITKDIFAPEPRALYEPAPAVPADREIGVSAALWEALAEEMERDERAFLMGEDVRGGGYFSVTAGLSDRFPSRVLNTPISEYAIVGGAVGAAMTGCHPVVEILFSDFLTTCMDPLVNQAAKLRYMSGGQYTLPLVVRTPGGAGIGAAAQHSQSLEAWLMHIPGLIIIAPGTAYDAKGLLKAAIRSNNPVLFFENKLLYAVSGPVPQGDYLVPIGVADVKRVGADVTLVAVGAALGLALDAAEELAAEGISAEIVDPRTLVPCDWAAIVRSAVKTGRVLTIENGPLTGGFGAECAARVTRAAWGALKRPVRRVAALDVPIPYNRTLENAALPDIARIVAAAREMMRAGIKPAPA